MNKNELHLHKLVCPNGGHSVAAYKEGETVKAYCQQCQRSYEVTQLIALPVDRTGYKPLTPPSVYGQPN